MVKLYIGNLTAAVDERDLRDEFSKYGRIVDFWMAKSPPGFAFLEYYDKRDAADAIQNLDGIEFRGTRLRVQYSKDDSKSIRRDNYRYPASIPVNPNEIKCFNCNSWGHKAIHCKKERNRGECYSCGEFGHKTAACTKNPLKSSYPSRSPPRTYRRSRSPPRRSRSRSPPRRRSRSRTPDDRRSPRRSRSPSLRRSRSRTRSRSLERRRSPSPRKYPSKRHSRSRSRSRSRSPRDRDRIPPNPRNNHNSS